MSAQEDNPDEVLRRLLNTPPQPHKKPHKPKAKKNASKPKKGK